MPTRFLLSAALTGLAMMTMPAILSAQTGMMVISSADLKDKIKGGWAGQTIGVTFGGPYEFRYDGTFIQDYATLDWNDSLVRKNMLDNPGLFDDLYMDLTFVDIMERYGINAPVDSFSHAFAHAGYTLWHANQSGRYNILSGIPAPASGFWMNNPHADCIDYQIESDFSGLMSPGMPNTASAISDRIGHIMNYGDGWYGGVFVGAMYTQAFFSNDVRFIIGQALKTIPSQSEFYQCITDVIKWEQLYPADWKQTWLEVQKKWANDIGCPDGVFLPFNIDAKVNAAYVVMGLLYGGGDFTRSLEIATRCGQDADCNPSTVGGILGTVLGYEKIPPYWKKGVQKAEDIRFKYTTMSLNDVYKTGYKHAVQNIEANGGRGKNDSFYILRQLPETVRFEKSFDSLYPVSRIHVHWNKSKTEISFAFEGTGFVIPGEVKRIKTDYVMKGELFLDGVPVKTSRLPSNYTTRSNELAWMYKIPAGKHSVRLRLTGAAAGGGAEADEAIVYSDAPVNGPEVNKKAELKMP